MCIRDRDGFKGQGRFASGAVPVRALMVAYPNRMHIVTTEGSGIQKVADLKGRRIVLPNRRPT